MNEELKSYCSSLPSSELSALKLEEYIEFVSHELRTSLTSILGVLSLFQTGHVSSLSQEGQLFLRMAISSADRLMRLSQAIEGEAIPAMITLSSSEIESLQLGNELALAIDRQELKLFYQPVVCVKEYQITGFEIIVRWCHPVKGWISPDVFISLAERMNLVNQISTWSLQQACHQFYLWKSKFSIQSALKLSIKVSEKQLLQPDFVQHVQQIIEQSKIGAESLRLEINDLTISENYKQTITVLSHLKTLDIQCYVNKIFMDFQILERLEELPIETVKIAASLVQNVRSDVSEIILLLLARLGLNAIATDVNSLEEATLLKALGYSQMQGSFFSDPVDSEMASMLISKPLTHYSQFQKGQSLICC